MFPRDSAALRGLRGAAVVSPRAGDARDRTPAGLDARNASHRPAVKPSSRRVERARSCPRQLENMAGSCLKNVDLSSSSGETVLSVFDRSHCFRARRRTWGR